VHGFDSCQVITDGVCGPEVLCQMLCIQAQYEAVGGDLSELVLCAKSNKPIVLCANVLPGTWGEGPGQRCLHIELQLSGTCNKQNKNNSDMMI
jgi:hypothetical protein